MRFFIQMHGYLFLLNVMGLGKTNRLVLFLGGNRRLSQPGEQISSCFNLIDWAEPFLVSFCLFPARTIALLVAWACTQLLAMNKLNHGYSSEIMCKYKLIK